MAFQPVNLTLWSNAQSPNSPPTLPQWWGYDTTTDDMAVVSAAGYFNLNPNTLLQRTTFRINDLVYCACTDGIIQLQINALSPNITTTQPPADIPAGSITTAMLGNLIVTAPKIANATITTTQISATAGIVGTQLANGTVTATQLAANAVTTAGILNANVTLAKLAPGITPSHVVKFAAQYTTVGGAAAEAITIAGVLASDLPFVQLVAPGTNTVSVTFAVATTNTLTVTFSANPGNNAIVNYQILRAAS